MAIPSIRGFHLHFTPTSSSWLNLVERWFREPTDKMIRRGVFGSVDKLVTAIEEYLRYTTTTRSRSYRPPPPNRS